MCDTFICRGSQFTIFGKNSDREPNEAQEIRHLFPMERPDKTVKCTFISIPAFDRLYEVILSCPFQMWGAEMGCNEKGVVVGNEAVFTKIPFKKQNNGLTGMDIIRIVLETSSSSEQAVYQCIELIENYGQDASGGYQQKNFYYHNSFIISDPYTSWKLETAGNHWAAKKIKDFDAISNGLTIDSDYDLISDHAIDYAVKNSYISKNEAFSFSKAYSSKLYTFLSKCKIRRQSSIDIIKSKSEFNEMDAAQLLRSHNGGNSPFKTAHANASSICMHPTSILNPSQTNGSLIVKLKKDGVPEIWSTGTSMPCLSVFKPLIFGKALNTGAVPGAIPDHSFWWKSEKVHRLICKDYENGTQIIMDKIHQLQEESFNLKCDQMNISLIQDIWDSHMILIDTMLKNSELIHQKWKSFNPFYRFHQSRMNKIFSEEHIKRLS